MSGRIIAKPFRLPHSSLDLPRALPWAVIFLPFQGDWPDLTHSSDKPRTNLVSVSIFPESDHAIILAKLEIRNPKHETESQTRSAAMMIPWFERKFACDEPLFIFPLIVERLRGTPARLEERLTPLSASQLVQRKGEKWSIQEQAGHLLDLEPLWAGRISDVLDGWDVRRPADLTNRKTHEAAHNRADLGAILQDFREQRARLVESREGLDANDVQRGSLHPRLKKPMRILDLAYFVAEHDDHHLAVITRLLSNSE